MKRYHGWIVVEDAVPGHVATVMVEWTEERSNGRLQRRRKHMNKPGNEGCRRAIEWWDERAGAPVSIEPLFKGQYRVYTGTGTEEEEAK